MENAVSIATGKPRTDGWYREWIGLKMQFLPIYIGSVAHFRYTSKQSYLYPGTMHTSPVVSVNISDDKNTVKVETLNTIYTFRKEEASNEQPRNS